MSGRKRIYVDEAEWNRLRHEANKLAEVKRDLPKLVKQVQEQTQRDLDRSLREVDNRQAEFERAVSQLTDQTRQVEERAAKKLRATSDRLRQQITEEGRQLRAETASALRDQRELLQHAIDDERRERKQQLSKLETQVAGLQGNQARAGELAAGFLADAMILREQVVRYPHERYLPGQFEALDRRLDTVRANVESGVGAYGLSGAQEVCQQLGELRLELERLDREWRTCRIAAERDLVRMQGLLAQNAKLDLRGQLGDDTPGTAPDVDHWSRGALNRLGSEVAALLAQVRDDEQPMSTESLLRIVNTTMPEFELRLESVVGQAVTAMQASQLRTNLADLIADALDRHHQYEVTEAGFAGEDQREAFLAKTVHLSGSEIVIEVEPGQQDQPPTVRLHNFDADNASELERAARTQSIQKNVRQYTGIELTAQEEDAQPDEEKHDVGELLRQRTTTMASQVGDARAMPT